MAPLLVTAIPSTRQPPTVGVVPSSQAQTQRLLLSALEQVFDVVFIVSDTIERARCDALIVLDGSLYARESDFDGLKVLLFAPPRVANRRMGDVCFADSTPVDARLRGRVLSEREASAGFVEVGDGTVLATDVRSRPLWVRKEIGNTTLDEVAVAAPFLRAGEALRDHFVPGRFLGLLPLVQFLRELAREGGARSWRPAPLRATFVIDDPNLHWRSYGPLDYRQLAAHAARFNYHIGIGTIPLDACFVYRPVGRLFRDNSERLSVAVHGNNHTESELGRPRSDLAAIALLAQALRRVDRLEARSGARVSRLMVPPWEACSQQTLRLLMLLGYDGLTHTRPHPWITLADQISPHASSPDHLTGGWFPAEMQDDGFPILIRRTFFERDEVVLRAYLDQPLIFYGHIKDLVSGLDPLEELAQEINGLPGVRWCSLGEVADSNFETRRLDERTLRVRPFARRLRIGGLQGVEEITFDWVRRRDAMLHVECLASDGTTRPAHVESSTRTLRLGPEVDRAHVTLVPRDAIDYKAVPAPRRDLRPAARRVLTETRDRFIPYIARLRR